jgi:hypothetical protein
MMRNSMNCTHRQIGIIRMIKSRMMFWAYHVACMGREEMLIKFWLQSLKG